MDQGSLHVAIVIFTSSLYSGMYGYRLPVLCPLPCFFSLSAGLMHSFRTCLHARALIAAQLLRSATSAVSIILFARITV